MYKNLLIILITLFSFQTFGQHLACFSDTRHNFYVFDAGNVKKIENLQVYEYQVGGQCIAYLDNAENLKVYYNGRTELLEGGGNAIDYYATDYLLGYKQMDFLKVYDKGQLKVLCTATEAYKIEDSLMAWYSKYEHQLKVYYKGETIVLEDGLNYFPVEYFESGDNILAYRTAVSDIFKVFYQGRVYELDNIGAEMDYKAGRDIVAWYDNSRSIFKVFYKGETYELEYFEPKSFKVGDDMVVYVDYQDNFKVFNEGVTSVVRTYPPENYQVVDRVFTFEDQGFLKTWCDETVQIITRYIPVKYVLDFNTIAYLDNVNFVKCVQDCNKFNVTAYPVQDIEVFRDLIMIKVGFNSYNIYYFGQIFEYSY